MSSIHHIFIHSNYSTLKLFNEISDTVSKDEVIDLETLPLSGTAIQTSPMPAVSRINAANQSAAEQSSPQFIVGWKDEAESNDMGMLSRILLQ